MGICTSLYINTCYGPHAVPKRKRDRLEAGQGLDIDSAGGASKNVLHTVTDSSGDGDIDTTEDTGDILALPRKSSNQNEEEKFDDEEVDENMAKNNNQYNNANFDNCNGGNYTDSNNNYYENYIDCPNFEIDHHELTRISYKAKMDWWNAEVENGNR